MTIFPDTRLLVWLGVWVCAAVAAVLFPMWMAPVVAFAGVLLLWVGWDALLLRASARPRIERDVPHRAVIGRESEVALRIGNRAAQPRLMRGVEELPRDLAPNDPDFQMELSRAWIL